LEQIAHHRITSSDCHASLFRLPPYLWAVLVMVIGFTALITGVRALAHDGLPSTNPFASFSDVFPGRTRTGIEALGFLCRTHPWSDGAGTPEELCESRPYSGPFSLISLSITQGHIRSSIFVARAGALQVGDLLALWGRPEVRPNGHVPHLAWRRRGIGAVITSYHGAFSLFLYVWKVYLSIPSTEA
jgi:hypothetical protein